MRKPVGWSEIRRRLDRCNIRYAEKELDSFKALALRYNMFVECLNGYLEERKATECAYECFVTQHNPSSSTHYKVKLQAQP